MKTSDRSLCCTSSTPAPYPGTGQFQPHSARFYIFLIGAFCLALWFPPQAHAFLWWKNNNATSGTTQQTSPKTASPKSKPHASIKWYVTYTQNHPLTGKVISKTTRGFGDPHELMRQDEQNHPYARELGYGPPIMSRYTSNVKAFHAYSKKLYHDRHIARTYAPYPYKTTFGYTPPKDEPPEETHRLTAAAPPPKPAAPPPVAPQSVSRTYSHARIGLWDHGD